MEEKKFRYQVLRLTALNTLAANQTTELGIKPDPGYSRITGISIMEVSNGGIPLNYRVGVRDDSKPIIDPVNIQHWSAAYVAPDDKFLKVNKPYGDGANIYCDIINQAILTSDLVIEMTLRLELDLTEMPR